jgi:hypothetical protein
VYVKKKMLWLMKLEDLHGLNYGSKFVCETCTCVQLQFARARRR